MGDVGLDARCTRGQLSFAPWWSFGGHHFSLCEKWWRRRELNPVRVSLVKSFIGGFTRETIDFIGVCHGLSVLVIMRIVEVKCREMRFRCVEMWGRKGAN
jgi:hypothetical protein